MAFVILRDKQTGQELTSKDLGEAVLISKNYIEELLGIKITKVKLVRYTKQVFVYEINDKYILEIWK